MTTTSYKVTGMSCEHCANAVTSELRRLDGVSAVTVDLVPDGVSLVTVTSAHPLAATRSAPHSTRLVTTRCLTVFNAEPSGARIWECQNRINHAEELSCPARMAPGPAQLRPGRAVAGSCCQRQVLPRSSPLAASIARLTRDAAAAPAAAGGRALEAPRPGSPAAIATTPPAGGGPLAGKVVVIDPGHNPHNPGAHCRDQRAGQRRRLPEVLRHRRCGDPRRLPRVRFHSGCCQAGAFHLAGGGRESDLTQNGKHRYGPCINSASCYRQPGGAPTRQSPFTRTAGLQTATVSRSLVPVLVQNPSADNSMIIEPSRDLADALLTHFAAVDRPGHGPPTSALAGIQPRSDLGGLNCSTVPKVFIECANMRNAADAAKVTDEHWRQAAARGIAQSIAAFITAH